MRIADFGLRIEKVGEEQASVVQVIRTAAILERALTSSERMELLITLQKNPQSEIRNPQSEIRNPQSEIRNPKSAIRNQKT